MTPRVAIGDRVPQVTLSRVGQAGLESVCFHALTASKRALIAGIPGVFTPVCTAQHLPDLIQNASRLRAAGFTALICVAPDNPWSVAAWAREIDPFGALQFLSDGNLALARALGVLVPAQEYWLGETSTRYLMVAERGIVRRFNVERHFTLVDCTRANDAVVLD